jgi:NitT/TauT family transport system permease protein
VTSPDGLGGLVWAMAQTFLAEQAFAAVAVIACLGPGLPASLRFAERRVDRWRPH